MTDKFTYGAWGNLAAHQQFSGSVDQPYQYVGQLGYYTHVQDENMDLLQLGVRFYDPETGRFTQRDPFPNGSESGYLYVADRPTRSTDSRGFQAEDFEDEMAYNQCVSEALRKFNKCVAETYGVTDIGGAVVGCLAGCAIISIWNGELTWAPCAVACVAGAGCYTVYTLGRTYFKCVVPYMNDMRECERLRKGDR